jgi:hypothetical protein
MTMIRDMKPISRKMSQDSMPGDGHEQRAGAAERIFSHLKGVVILGGAVRPSALMEGIGRSLLDLPLNGRRYAGWWSRRGSGNWS